MVFGLDYVAGPPLDTMKTHIPPVEFVCRYVGYFSGYNIDEVATPQGKCLTPGEAKALSLAGIAVVSNWEWSADRAVQGYSVGVWDAVTASKIHLACGGPEARPIYFSVDEAVDGAKVAAYFQGVASVLGLPRTGAYGSDLVLKYLFDHGLITWGWQTYAWSGGAWESRAHIRQYQNDMKMAGASVDYNESMKDDFGQWFSGQLGSSQEEHMTPLTLADVKSFFTENKDGSWTRIDPKTGVAMLDSLNKPIVLKGAILTDWCNHGTDALPDIGLPVDNETQVDPAAHPEIVDQQFERVIRRFDPKHIEDSPPHAGSVYSPHIEGLYSAEVKLQMALDQLAATQKQLAAALAASPESAYVAAVQTVDTKLKEIQVVIDPLVAGGKP